jgi:hypothetical protein
LLTSQFASVLSIDGKIMEVLQMQRNERNGTIVEYITDCEEAVVVIGVVAAVVVRGRQPGFRASLS